MKSRTILGILLVLVLSLAACAPAQAATEPVTEPATEEPSLPPPTEVPVTEAPATEAPATEAPAETTTVGVPVTGAATVEVSESADFGPILVDGQGMSLYLFLADTQDSGISTCGDDDGCAAEWPPLVVSEGD